MRAYALVELGDSEAIDLFSAAGWRDFARDSKLGFRRGVDEE